MLAALHMAMHSANNRHVNRSSDNTIGITALKLLFLELLFVYLVNLYDLIC